MTELVAELIVSIDCCARGERSPAYYGYYGPEFGKWLADKSDEPHRNLMGRKTYELLAQLPEQHRDEDYRKMANTPGWVFSAHLPEVQWAGLTVVRSDLYERVSAWKSDGGDEIRVIGSLSIVRQLVATSLVDRLRLITCPLVLPQTGLEPIFADYPDTQFELLDTKVLDGRIIVSDYRPNGAAPQT